MSLNCFGLPFCSKIEKKNNKLINEKKKKEKKGKLVIASVNTILKAIPLIIYVIFNILLIKFELLKQIAICI